MITDKRVPFHFILNKVKFDLLMVLLIGIVTHLVKNGFSEYVPKLPISVPLFLGTAISILLSFKMSQSYDRWWEARKIWGAIVNDSRTLIIQLQTFLLFPGADQVTKAIAYRQIAWNYALGRSLRKLPVLDNLEEFFSAEDLKQLSNHSNKPLGIIQLNAHSIRKLKEEHKIDGFTHLQIDNTFTRLCDSMGKAERINNTVFPTTYRLFLHFSIYLFVVLLSISLEEIVGVYEIALLCLIAIVFFLLEKTAFHLQDPFRNRPSDTPVTAIATTIEINIRQLLGEIKVPQQSEKEDFYIL